MSHADAPSSNALARWMRDVLRLHAAARRNASEPVVHDLRVTLRRCRSAARCAGRLDADPAWHELRDRSKRLFRALGELRDAQVQIRLVGSWNRPADPALRVMRTVLRRQEKKAKSRARRALAKFDRSQWRALAGCLPARLDALLVDPASITPMILERWRKAQALYLVTARDDSPPALHAARIGGKQLRYALESLAPVTYETWKPVLRRAQNLLGSIHDSDVFRATLEQSVVLTPRERTLWRQRIARRRLPLVVEYRTAFTGRRSPWPALRRDIERDGTPSVPDWPVRYPATEQAHRRVASARPARTAPKAAIGSGPAAGN